MSDIPKARHILLDDFKQSWEHLRHIEEQRWTIIKIYFALTGGLVTLGLTLFESNLFPIEILMVICLIAIVWGIMTIQMILKLRLEFCLHMTNINMIRIFFKNINGREISEEHNIFAGSKIIQFFKPTSVHMSVTIPILITTTLISFLIPYLYYDNVFKIDVVSSFNISYIIFTVLFFYIIILCNGYELTYGNKTSQFSKKYNLETIPNPSNLKIKKILLIPALLTMISFVINLTVVNQLITDIQLDPLAILQLLLIISNVIIPLLSITYSVYMTYKYKLYRVFLISLISTGLNYFTGNIIGLILNIFATLILFVALFNS